MKKIVLFACLLMFGCDGPNPNSSTSKWLKENGDEVKIIQLDGVIDYSSTMFVVESVKTHEIIKAVASDKAAVVGEYWKVDLSKREKNGWGEGDIGFLSLTEKIKK